MAKTLIGLYDTLDDAQSAVQDLVQNGIPRDDIGFVWRRAEDAPAEGLSTHEDATNDAKRPAAQGAEVGAAVGGIGGLLIGLTTLVVPVMGPLLVAGPLAAALAGAGMGAAGGGLLGALVNMGMTHEEASVYADAVQRGGPLVLVKTSEAAMPQAKAIMSHHRPLELGERSSPRAYDRSG